MRFAGLLISTVLAAVPLAAQISKPVTVPLVVELPDNPAAGARLFVQKGCARCHALGGDQTRLGPDLGRIHYPGTALDVAGALWNHAPVMREKMADLKIRPPVLDTQEVADLVAFLTAYRYYLAEVGGPGTPSAGRTVFRDKGCTRCHPDGERDAWNKPAPDLSRHRGRLSAIVLAQSMWNHRTEMETAMRDRGVPWPQFRGREMADLLAYLQSGNGASGAERVYFEPGSPRRGREIFTTKRCIACHAVAGEGGRGGPDLGSRPGEMIESVASIAGLMWNHSQEMSAEVQRRHIGPVTFSGQEMADVFAYLYFINYATARGAPGKGAELFAAKCSACHTMGDGARVGPDLQGVPRLDSPTAIISAMWNHAPRMEEEFRKLGRAWPRLAPGDVADLAAFLLEQRRKAGTFP